MAGIAGIIYRVPKSQGVGQVPVMVQRMCHGASLHSGQCEVDRVGVAGGWVCRPGSFSDCMPVWNEDRNVCLIFTGEDFCAGDELSALRHRGHRDVRADASALVHLYEELGPKFFGRLNGWFSGLLVDLRNEIATLFNDRYGLSRIYYHESAEGFYFASEAKSLLAVLPHLRRIDQRGLAEFFTVGCALQNRSLFPDVSILPGGAVWKFHRDGRVDKGHYFDPETWQQQERLTPAEYGERLREVFSRVMPRYLRGSEPMAMSLTGGLDSRMILAWAKAPPATLPCYTFGGPYRDSADVRIARRLAQVCGQPHQTIRLGAEFLQGFPSLAEETVYISDGAMDVSGAVELYVNRKARQVAPVRMTGNYGSEILRAHVAFKPTKLDEAFFDCEFSGLLRGAKTTYAEEIQCPRLSFIAFKQVPWHHFGRLAVEQSQLTLRSPYLDNELVALAYRMPPELVASSRPLLRLICSGNPALGQQETDRALRQSAIPMISPALQFSQQFTARAEYAYDYGMPQWLAKIDRILAPLHLEKLFLGRHKFYHFRVWYRDSLAHYLKEILLDRRARQRSYYRGHILEKSVNDHVSGRCNYTLALHKALTVELIQEHLIGQG